MSGPRTGTSNTTTTVIENGERVYPCRCGETHRGDYGHYDWAHHNCFHTDPLQRLVPDADYLICPQCGLTFLVAS